jgi:transposase InsO family protein
MNILYGKLSNDRITRWRLLLEEYGPEYVHIKGQDNVVADALSRLDMNKLTKTSENENACLFAYVISELPLDTTYVLPDGRDSEEMAYEFTKNKEENLEKFPMNPRLIAKEQKKDKSIQKSILQGTKEYILKNIEGTELLTYNGRIIIPKALTERIVEWYHCYLRHPGQVRMDETLRQIYYWDNMRAMVQRHVKSCKLCQLCKKPRKQYGHLPAKTAEESEPWSRVNVDMMGPLTVKTPTKIHELLVLTMIDPATGWFEVAPMKNATSETAMTVMDDVWFSRYPRPKEIGFDNGSEYKKVFKEMVTNYGLKRKASLSWNPQSNGIVERIHQVLADGLRTFELEKQELDDVDPWTPFLAACAFAIRSTYHTTLQASPAQLVFGRDMLLPIKFKANWARIRANRQRMINQSNLRENKKRLVHDYKVGDKVLLTKPGLLRKLSTPRSGPYLVKAVHTNGTIHIQRGVIKERVNIRRVTPFVEN